MIYYICVLDFEATCFQNNEVPRNKMEIIEFPSLLYKINTNTKSYELISEFHKYVRPTNGKVWFGLRDVIKVLQYSNIEKAITKIKISKINKKTYDNIEPHPRGVGSIVTIKPHKIFINESGLYEILLRSTKSLAKIFTYKLLTEIMPQIREKGEYILKDSEKKKLDKMNNKLDNYERAKLKIFDF
jgi:prophage antirepressor-like protein